MYACFINQTGDTFLHIPVRFVSTDGKLKFVALVADPRIKVVIARFELRAFIRQICAGIDLAGGKGIHMHGNRCRCIIIGTDIDSGEHIFIA